jgi:hypothetical protein
MDAVPCRLLAVAFGLIVTVAVTAAEQVGVAGSSAKYDVNIVTQVGDKETRLVLTGTALRRKFFVNVYTVASYLQEGRKVRSAEELAAADYAKQLHVTLERDVSGKDIFDAFREGVLANHPKDDFSGELQALSEFLKMHSVKQGEHVFLTHIPGVGLAINIADKAECRIENVAFARAIWDIYFGAHNLGNDIRRGLTSRL